MAQAIAGGDAEDVNLGSEAGGTAAANNALLAPLLVALASIGAGYYGTLFIGENVLQLATGEDVVVNDPVANVLSDMEQGAVNIAYDNAPETTKQVFRALENIGSAAEGVIIYADLATGQNVSAVWGDLSPETKIRIQSGGALVSLIVAPSVAKKLSNSTPNIKPKITTDFNIVAKNSAGLATKSFTDFDNVGSYISKNGQLPDNFITKQQARELGWEPGKDLSQYAPGKSIGGDVYGNKSKVLPDAPDRTWYEADINYSNGKRGADRVVYSSDGLVYKTSDHYKTFERIK